MFCPTLNYIVMFPNRIDNKKIKNICLSQLVYVHFTQACRWSSIRVSLLLRVTLAMTTPFKQFCLGVSSSFVQSACCHSLSHGFKLIQKSFSCTKIEKTQESHFPPLNFRNFFVKCNPLFRKVNKVGKLYNSGYPLFMSCIMTYFHSRKIP